MGVGAGGAGVGVGVGGVGVGGGGEDLNPEGGGGEGRAACKFRATRAASSSFFARVAGATTIRRNRAKYTWKFNPQGNRILTGIRSHWFRRTCRTVIY